MAKKYAVMAVLAMAVGIGVAIMNQSNSSWPSAVGFHYQPPKKIAVSPLKIAPKVDEQDNLDKPEILNEDFFKDKWTLVFIGFTYCPDICPSAMSNLARLEKAIIDKKYADDFQVLFVSVDPARDSLEKISKFAHFFSPNFTAVTGSVEELEAMTNSMNLLFLIPEDTSEGNYLVDHSASFALVSPQGDLIANIRETNNIDLMVEALDSLQ